MFKFSQTSLPKFCRAKFRQEQKGLTLFIAIIMLAIILSIVLGLSTILVGQIKIIRWMGTSVVAFYAADTGIEETLKIVLGGDAPRDYYPPQQLDNTASYEVRVFCCDSSNGNCDFYLGAEEPESCPIIDTDGKPDETDECQATRFCVWSNGKYRDTKRAIEVRIKPVNP